MALIATPFGSSAGKYNFLGTATLTNCFAELRNDGGKARYVIVPSDGTTSFSSVTDTPCRGAVHYDDLDLAYTVHSGRIYSVTSAGTATSRGVIPGQDKVRIVRNQKITPQILVHCSAGVYVMEAHVVSKIIDSDLPTSVTLVDIAVFDGYTVYAYSDGRFFISSLNEATTIDALDFATAESSPDGLVAVYVLGEYLLLFGTRTIEPWRNTGDADFPFTPMPTIIPRGCASRWSITKFDNSLVFLGDDGIIYRLNGFQPVRISDHEVERLIQTESDPSVIEAQTWSRAGHAMVEFKGTNWSKVYDANTQQWHDRESYGQDVWRHVNAFPAWNKTIYGDKLTGNLYYADATVHTEAGGTQVATMRFPPLQSFGNGFILDAVHLDFLTGQGATLTTAQGYDPILMFRIYKDGGNVVAFERELKTGKRGAYQGSVTTRRLGKCGGQGAVIEIAMSDPVGRALALCDAEVRPLAA